MKVSEGICIVTVKNYTRDMVTSFVLVNTIRCDSTYQTILLDYLGPDDISYSDVDGVQPVLGTNGLPKGPCEFVGVSPYVLCPDIAYQYFTPARSSHLYSISKIPVIMDLVAACGTKHSVVHRSSTMKITLLRELGSWSINLASTS